MNTGTWNRRGVLGALAAPLALRGVAAPIAPRGRALLSELARDPGGGPDDEDFWRQVQRAFDVDRSMVNLNNGGVSPSPRVVQDAYRRHLDAANAAPAYTMWRLQEPQKESVRAGLARLLGADSEEVAITRNTSESLWICQHGHDLEPGDEVLTSNQDYPRMLAAFRQRARREGIVLREVSLPVPGDDDDEIVRRFEAALTDRTKLILCSHMVNLTGQVLPVRRIVELGRARGVPVLVDGAHTFAHLPFELADLGCDFYATSLHKWLFAPFGTGLLFVRRRRIRGLWPLTAADESLDDDIRKFEQIGTHAVPLPLAVADAIAFHDALGAERKYARMVALRDRWAERLASEDRVRFHTDMRPGRAGGIANVRIEGIDTADLQRHLWRDHRIYTITIRHDEFEGLRVSPSVYTSPEEIDRFADVVERALRDGLPR